MNRFLAWIKGFMPSSKKIVAEIKVPDNQEDIPKSVKDYKEIIEERRISESATFRNKVIVVYVVILLFLVFVVLPISAATSTNYFLWSMLALTVYTIGSIATVQPDESGVKTIFGKRVAQIVEGLEWVPLFIGKLNKVSIAIQQDELPAEPQFIFRPQKHESQVPPRNFFPPTRVPFGWPIKSIEIEPGKKEVKGYRTLKDSLAGDESKKVKISEPGMILSRDGFDVILHNADSEDPLNLRVTEEVVSIPRYYVVDPMKFVRKLVSLDRARDQLRDEVEAIYFRDYSMYTPAVIMRNTKYFNEVLLHELRELAGRASDHDSWGIVMESVKLKQIVLSHSLNDSIQRKAEATGDKAGRVVDAAAERIELEERGAGRASAAKALELAKLEGRTEGLVYMARELGVSAKDVLGTETVRGITEGASDKIIIPGNDGFSKLMGMGLAVGDSITESKKKDADKDKGEEDSQ